MPPYEIVFHIAGYFGPDTLTLFDDITIRFLVSDETANYRLPLLLAPHEYSSLSRIMSALAEKVIEYLARNLSALSVFPEEDLFRVDELRLPHC